MPWQNTIQVMDSNRDAHDVNGWIVQMPKIRFTISLDVNPHPQRMYLNFDTSITGEKSDVNFHTSLTKHDPSCGYFACFDTDWVFPNMLGKVIEAVSSQASTTLKNP